MTAMRIDVARNSWAYARFDLKRLVSFSECENASGETRLVKNNENVAGFAFWRSYHITGCIH